MSELKLMIERLSEREKNAIRNKLNEFERKAELETKKAKNDAKNRLEEEKERILQELDYEFSMKQNTENVNFRNAILREKQKVIQQTFKEATHKLDEMSSEEFMGIVATALKNVDVTQTVRLYVGERSKELFDWDWLRKHLPWNHHVTVEPEFVKNRAGVLVRKDNIDYNYFFDELIKENRQDLLPYVTKKLFED